MTLAPAPSGPCTTVPVRRARLVAVLAAAGALLAPWRPAAAQGGGGGPPPAVPSVAAPPKLTRPDTDVVFLELLPAGSYVWYVGSYMRQPFEVRLHNVTNERACRARLVEFAAQEGAPASAALTVPSADIAAEWVQAGRGVVCRARTRWRLSDVPGRQTLTARLVRGDSSIVPDSVLAHELSAPRREWIASANLVPTVVAGFSYALGGRARAAGGADSVLTSRGQAFFGADFAPFAFGSSPAWSHFSEHVRVTLGTSYRAPGRDVYIGLNPVVLIDGLRSTTLPVQSTAGYRRGPGNRGAFVVGGTVNALALVGLLIGKL